MACSKAVTAVSKNIVHLGAYTSGPGRFAVGKYSCPHRGCQLVAGSPWSAGWTDCCVGYWLAIGIARLTPVGTQSAAPRSNSGQSYFSGIVEFALFCGRGDTANFFRANGIAFVGENGRCQYPIPFLHPLSLFIDVSMIDFLYRSNAQVKENLSCVNNYTVL